MGRRVAVAQAGRALDIINRLTHTKGPFAGQPFNFRPWQVRIVKQLFKTAARTGCGSIGRAC